MSTRDGMRRSGRVGSETALGVRGRIRAVARGWMAMRGRSRAAMYARGWMAMRARSWAAFGARGWTAVSLRRWTTNGARSRMATILISLTSLACSGDSAPRPEAPGEASPAATGAENAGTTATADETPDMAPSRILVAHRGASAYAPEHTLEAYRLALDQGADFIEPDLQVTRDGVLVCMHDLTLERTTDVEEVFPDRYREERNGLRTVRRWYVSDFTLDEIKRLDAGSWFGERFRGSRVPTLDEAIEVALGSAGIFPETKAPEVYGDLGYDMERLLVETLAQHGLDTPGGVPGTPVIVQSFSPESLRILRNELGSELSLTLLVSAPDRDGWLTPGGLERAAAFATGVGPSKRLVLANPQVVEWAHDRGLTVIPYTFASDEPGGFASGTAEQAHYLWELGVDGLFTNNPDHFPREQGGGSAAGSTGGSAAGSEDGSAGT